MNEYYLIGFMLFWAFADRIKEIAVFPGWTSAIHEWLDTHYTDILPDWVPFRDAYHLFKALPVYLLCGFIWYKFGFMICLYSYAAWATGQFLGLATRKKV